MKRSVFLFSGILLLTAITILMYQKFFDALQSLPEILTPEIESETVDLPMLTFCELVNNPEKYDNKTVYLRARLSIGTEGSWFSDSKCGIDNAAFVSVTNEQVWKDIEKARERGRRKPSDNELDLIVLGKFRNLVYKDWCCLTTPFQFEISNIEKASKAY